MIPIEGPIISSSPMTADVFSLACECKDLAVASIQAIWTGASALGSIFLEISNDNVSVGSSVTNWSTYTGSSTAVSGPGNFMWNLNLAGYRWVRVHFAYTSGTGTLNAQFNGKVQS